MAIQILNTNLVAILLVSGLVYIALSVIKGQKPPKGTRFAPSPSGHPIIGNVVELSSGQPYNLLFHKWYEQLKAPVYSFSVLGTKTYMVNTPQAVTDLFVLRSAVFSSRPEVPSVNELLGRHRSTGTLPVDPKHALRQTQLWQRQRKFMQHHLSAAALEKEPLHHEIESLRLAKSIGHDPTQYHMTVERYSASIIFRLTYGKALSTGQEPIVLKAKHFLSVFLSALVPGTHIVDVFPMLMMVPTWLAPWKQKLDKEGADLEDYSLGLLKEVEDRLEDNRAPTTLARHFLTDGEKIGLSRLDGSATIAGLYGAGSPTTAAAVETVLFALVHHPEWVEKSHQELDRVVGVGRVPTFDDIPNLPVVRAIITEAQRWRPPPSLPHATAEDAVYDGMFIPRGSTLFANTRSISRDPELYPDPESFNPQRWLSPEYPTYKEPLTRHPHVQSYQVFGHGRRICPGQHLAERSLLIGVTRILWTYRISKAKDKTGAEVPVHWEDFDFPLYRPKNFALNLLPWDEKRHGIVEDALQQVIPLDPVSEEKS